MILVGKAHLRRVRISPKKAKLVADIIRGMDAKTAMETLQFTRKRPAVYFLKALKSAIASYKEKAGADAVDLEDLMVFAKVDKGPQWKILKPAVKPMRFGGYATFTRRTSHLTVHVVEKKDWEAYKEAIKLPYNARKEVLK